MGASIGSATQLKIFKAQQKRTSLEARLARKRIVYEDYLHFVMGLPDSFRNGFTAAFIGPGGAEVVFGPFRSELYRLRVLLMLDASRSVKNEVEVLHTSVRSMLQDEWPKALKEEHDPPQSVVDTFDDVFKRCLLPEIEALSDLMASELNSDGK
jgi:hypothetical protein